LLALVQSGLSRDDAYRIVQEAAGISWAQSRDFRTVLEENERIRQLDPAILDEAFDLHRSIRRIGSVFEALDRVEI
jgi:adenylosuccinate lyase